MNDPIDGIPVTKRSVRFEGELSIGSAPRAGQIMPMVVLVSVGGIEHTPGSDDDYHRVDVLEVSRLASPRSVEENEYLLGLLRGQTVPEPRSVPEPEEAVVEADVVALDETERRLAPRVGGGLQVAARPVDDAVLDEEDDFVLPPPPPIPEGTETRRQIVPGDPQLRTFLGE